MKKIARPKIRIQWPAFTTVIWILCGLAIFSMLALDRINWKKGEKSYIFTGKAPIVTPLPPERPLSDLVLESLSAVGIRPEEVRLTSGIKGETSCRFETEAARFLALEPSVEKELQSRSISIEVRKKSEGEEKTELRWLLKRGKEMLDLTFAWPAGRPPKAEPKPEPAPPPPPAKPAAPGLVALVVDDMGNSLEILDELVALHEPVTVSILPFSSYGRETARIAHDQGLEVILHLPLESLNGNGSEIGTEGLIQSGMSKPEILRLMDGELSQIPYIRGVNNHMGSKVTADESLMRIILEPIKERGLFFLDSRTSGRSVAFEVARKMGVPTSFRQVFLDADENNGLIKERLIELFRIAQKNGRAIGICHPFRETIQTLKANFSLLESYGLKAAVVSELIRP